MKVMNRITSSGWYLTYSEWRLATDMIKNCDKLVELISAVAVDLSIEQCIDVSNVFKVNCKENGVTFFEVSLVFLLVNLDMFVTWIWFSAAVQRKLG